MPPDDSILWLINLSRSRSNIFFLIFSSEHYSYFHHGCKNAKLKDNQVPVCPMCSKPVPAEKGREDFEVSRHIDQFCKTETKIFTNQCTFGKCKKRELIPFKCSSCDKNYCLKHRYADVHECKGKTSTNQSQRNMLAWVSRISKLQNQIVSKKSYFYSEAALRRQQSNNRPSHARNVQGNMSEDEALARALEASMRESYQQTVSVGGSSSGNHDKNKCTIAWEFFLLLCIWKLGFRAL